MNPLHLLSIRATRLAAPLADYTPLVHHHYRHPIRLAALLLVLFIMFVLVGWVLPITLGIMQAKRKNHSPLWMLFGIHPLGGWIAFIIMACITPRVRCHNCGGYVGAEFRLCPYCRADPGGGAPGPTAQGNVRP